MGVTVQLMVDADVSGVLFTCNPVSGDPSMVAINASWGLGVAVVGGEVTPDDYLVSKVTGEVVRAERWHDKHVEYVPRPERPRRDPRRRADRAPQCRAASTTPTIAELVDVARAIERHFGAPQDVEWAIARDTSRRAVRAPVPAGDGAARGATPSRSRRRVSLRDEDVRRRRGEARCR